MILVVRLVLMKMVAPIQQVILMVRLHSAAQFSIVTDTKMFLLRKQIPMVTGNGL